MRPFSKKRSIKNFIERVRSGFNGSAALKFILLFSVLVSTFYFKIWAARQQDDRPSSLPFASARKTTTKSLFGSDGSGDPKPGLLPGPIDVNTASSRDLQSLPGIGPRLANEIVQDRLRRGLFHHPIDLLRVRGIGPKKIRQIESYLRFKDRTDG